MQRAVEIAEREVGYHDIDGASKYFSELFPNRRREPWCVPFIEWVFQQAYGRDKALQMLCIHGNQFTPSVVALVNFIKHDNLFHYKVVQPGWLVFFRTNYEWTNHVELVVDVTDTEITSIGGNADGAVKKRTTARGDIMISGYGEIIYEEETTDEENNDILTGANN